MPSPRGRQRLLSRPRPALALLLALGIALAASACGSSGNSDVTLTIGSRATPEEEILGHIYVQALNAVGYDAKGEFGIETEYRDAPLKELEYGHISGYPEQVDAELRLFLGVEEEDMPRVAQKAYELARAKLAKQHLTAFPPTPYSVNRQVGMLRQTAEGRHLKTVSDLRGQAEEMMLSGLSLIHI